MRFECGVCQKTFRTKSGMDWHLERIHGQVRTFEVVDSSENDVGDQVAEMIAESTPLPATQNELVELIEGVVSEEVNNGESFTNCLLDEREFALMAKVKQMIAEMIGDSDQFLRAHVEHRIDDRLQAITAIHRESARPVEVAELPCDFRTAFMSCSLHQGHQRSIDPRYITRPMKIATDEMIRDALEYCGIAV